MAATVSRTIGEALSRAMRAPALGSSDPPRSEPRDRT
jgi:hypothetical protein